MQHKRAFLVAWLGLAAPAWAANEPLIAPAPSWVEPVTIPSPKPQLSSKSAQFLLSTAQTRYRMGADEYYVETATLAQNPQGLAEIGTIAIPWQPDLVDLIVHKAHILRGGKAIDLLAGGQKFTVLRRENKLEQAMLDGALTAVLQPQGLQVGDTLNLAFTFRAKPSSIPFAPENLIALPPGVPLRKAYFRQIWPAESQMKWRSTPAMGTPKLKQTKLGTELVLGLENVELAAPPTDAPQRFQMPAVLQVSGYKDWNAISALFAPVYAEAGKHPLNPELRTEVAKIAASTFDPRQRAMKALRLVQDRVRYVALAMGEGGYVPASIDQTWSRKYGDCKAKTVMLVALLKELGISAEPVLVSSVLGDTLGESLPQAKAFDHVVVRASIDGRSYWLDGTRSGDRRIDDLASSPFRWGLPLRSPGAALEQLPIESPSLPLIETSITYDASKGFFTPVGVSGELTYRGDEATMLRAAFAELGQEEFTKKAVELIEALPGGDGLKITYKPDEEQGAFTISFSGEQEMSWTGGASSKRVTYRFDNDTIRWEPNFKRESAAFQDLPYLLGFPVFLSYTENVILPEGGRGFTLEGKSFDRTVAGTQISRTISLENGRATAKSVFRQLKPEISAEEARASEAALKEINEDTAGVRAPESYKMAESVRAAMLPAEPRTAEEFNRRGYDFLQKAELAKAIADFDKAAALSPKWSLPVANRAISLLHQRKIAEGEEALKKAEALSNKDPYVYQGYGMLHLLQDKPSEAVKAFSRSLQIEPANAYTLLRRAEAYAQLRRFDDALADLDASLEAKPDDADALLEKARVAAWMGNEEEAIAAMDTLIAKDPDPYHLRFKAGLLKRFGKAEAAAPIFSKLIADTAGRLSAAPKEERLAYLRLKAELLWESGQPAAAVRELSGAIPANPKNALLLNARCWSRATAGIELEQALQDCDLALKERPNRASIIDSRAFVLLRMGRIKESIAEFDRALKLSPKMAAALYGRGIAKLRDGNREEGERDLAAARRIVFDIDAEYADYGIKPSAD